MCSQRFLRPSTVPITRWTERANGSPFPSVPPSSDPDKRTYHPPCVAATLPSMRQRRSGIPTGSIWAICPPKTNRKPKTAIQRIAVLRFCIVSYASIQKNVDWEDNVMFFKLKCHHRVRTWLVIEASLCIGRCHVVFSDKLLLNLLICIILKAP